MEEIEMKKGYPLILDTYVPGEFNKLKKNLAHLPETLIEILYDLHKFGNTVYYDTYLSLLSKSLLKSNDQNRSAYYRNSTQALMGISSLMLGTHPYVKRFLSTYSEDLEKRYYYLKNIRKKVLEEADKIRGELELEIEVNSASWQNEKE